MLWRCVALDILTWQKNSFFCESVSYLGFWEIIFHLYRWLEHTV